MSESQAAFIDHKQPKRAAVVSYRGSGVPRPATAPAAPPTARAGMLAEIEALSARVSALQGKLASAGVVAPTPLEVQLGAPTAMRPSRRHGAAGGMRRARGMKHAAARTAQEAIANAIASADGQSLHHHHQRAQGRTSRDGRVRGGRELLACAPTGSGKTAAYLIPMLAHLSARRPRDAGAARLRAIVVVPTQASARAVRMYTQRYKA